MDAYSNYLRDKLNDHIHGGTAYTPPVTLYFGLMTLMPVASGGGTEVTGGSYARVAATNNSSNFPASSGGSKQNANAITWPSPTANWGTVLGIAAYDASTGGNLLAFGTLTTATVINSGATPFAINSSGLTFNFASATNWSTYLQNKILDLVWSATSWTSPATTYISSQIVLPAADGTGGTEVTASGYGRTAVTNNSTSWPASSGQVKQNAIAFTLTAAAAASWGLVAGLAEWDAGTGGNLLEDAACNPTTVSTGQPFEVPVGGWQDAWQA